MWHHMPINNLVFSHESIAFARPSALLVSALIGVPVSVSATEVALAGVFPGKPFAGHQWWSPQGCGGGASRPRACGLSPSMGKSLSPSLTAAAIGWWSGSTR